MTLIRMARRADIAQASDDRMITVTISTQTIGRDDLMMVSEGVDLQAYRSNPVVLWQHNPDWPVARTVDIGVIGDDLVARVQFPAEGVSEQCDEIYGLIKAGIINAASTGVEIRDVEPVDPAQPKGAMRILRCELQEFSFVSIPAVPDALITERALKERRPMPAPNQDDPRRAVMKQALLQRGLYEVGNLAWLVQELGWAADCSAWEEEFEGDGSPVPAQLGAALQMLGEILVTMTQEEVAELVAAHQVQAVADAAEAEAEDIEAGDRVTLSAMTPVQRFRLGFVRGRRAAPPPLPKPAPAAETAPARSMVVHRRMASLYQRELARA